ncbi:MAG: methyltransferase domain-containing protein [Gemmatimonadota bacterium]
MRPGLVELLRCPRTGGRLRLEIEEARGDVVEQGALVSEEGARYPVLNGIPRFVPADNYAASFGLQWNRFRRTQLDSHSGHPISRERFYRTTGWTRAELAGARVLDVGGGAGRFAEVALEAGANVTVLDYSLAVDACRANLGHHERLEVVQGDVYALPFARGTFDFVYCLGVLQHTPDPRGAFLALPPMLRSGGRLAVDVYARLARNALWPKYWLRPVTRRLPPERLFRLVQRATPMLLPVSRALGRVPVVGRQLRYLVPVANYEGVLPLSRTQLEEWAILDTFDMLAPAHDHPQDAATLRNWCRAAGLVDVAVERRGAVMARGTKP